MPSAAVLLSVQKQGKRDVLWALVDHGTPYVPRSFCAVWTGEPAPEAVGLYASRFIGTIQRKGLVTHYFDLGVRLQ